ncbi:MAG: phage terminase small subunit P27 family [Bacteroidetes bacterium]|nr:MAG: phage terminase small subunit P27 family [Bacteroidota bacterium]
MKGRPPKPLQVKKLHGSQKCRMNLDEPKALVCIPECPPGLGKYGRQEWGRITTELEKLQMVATIDSAVLYGYCHSWDQFIQTSLQMKDEGYIIKTVTGFMQINPLVRVNNEAKKYLLKFAQELGLSVIQRTRIKIPAPDKEDEFETFISS